MYFNSANNVSVETVQIRRLRTDKQCLRKGSSKFGPDLEHHGAIVADVHFKNWCNFATQRPDAKNQESSQGDLPGYEWHSASLTDLETLKNLNMYNFEKKLKKKNMDARLSTAVGWCKHGNFSTWFAHIPRIPQPNPHGAGAVGSNVGYFGYLFKPF